MHLPSGHQAHAGLLLLFAISPAKADEPKPARDNTIHVQLASPVTPQKFARPIRFFVPDVVDRSGNAQPMLVMKERGGVFLDRQPALITREAITESLKTAEALAADAASAELVLQVYLFHFGLARGSGLDFFGKVEFSVTVKNPKTGESQQIQAVGTSIAGLAVRRKNMQKNVQENIEAALEDAVRNLLRGKQLKEAVAALIRDASNASRVPGRRENSFFSAVKRESVPGAGYEKR
jgi:hypothetical protein